jgi:hypothetical protein
MDPPEWRKLIALRKGKEGAEIRDLPFDYFLKDSNAPSLEENYLAHGGLSGKEAHK